tara:strand:+ start:552 stop:869 length:318 start_codon:yes stop_codon:yes gene_type:complete
MDNILTKILTYLLALGIVFGVIFIFVCMASIPLWLLWNWLIPPIFGLTKITLYQSAGLWTLMVLLRSTKFDWKESMTTLNTTIGDNTDDVEWDRLFSQIKKNYMA